MSVVAVGLDVGTTKICALVGKKDGSSIEIASAGFSPSTGLRKGVVVDMDKTTASIKKALAEAGAGTGQKIRSVYVGIAGGHIKGFNGYSAVCLGDKKVGESEVQRLIESAGAVYVPVDREVLHVIPAGFKLDGLGGIKDPVGMSGARLEAKVHIVTGAVASVQSLIRCCEKAGADVADIVLEPLASSESVLREEEKDRGVVLVDIGGGTTDIAVYRDGVLRHTAVLSLGGNHITNDIAVGLRLTAEDAERIKRNFGCATNDTGGRNDEAGTGFRGEITEAHIAEIIYFRCEEILHLVRKELESLTGAVPGDSMHAFFSGMVLTGGAATLKGLDALAGDIMGIQVRVGSPCGIAGSLNVERPEFATAIGLVHYGLRQLPEHECLRTQDARLSSHILERMKYWAKDFLNKKNLIKGGFYVRD